MSHCVGAGRALLSGRTAGAEGDYMNSLMTAYIRRNYYTANALSVVLLLSFWKVTQSPAFLLLGFVCNWGTLGKCQTEVSVSHKINSCTLYPFFSVSYILQHVHQ